MKDAVRTKSLKLHLQKKEGICHIHGIPEEAPEIQQWIEHLELTNLEYKGEGLPNISQKVLLHLTKNNKHERVYLTPEEKYTLLDAYDNRCAICRHKCKKFEWDHIERFAESWGEQNFQPLCPDCHTEKHTLSPALWIPILLQASSKRLLGNSIYSALAPRL